MIVNKANYNYILIKILQDIKSKIQLKVTIIKMILIHFQI